MALIDCITERRQEVVAAIALEVAGMTECEIDLWVNDEDGPLMAAEEVCCVQLEDSDEEAVVFKLLDELVLEARASQ